MESDRGNTCIPKLHSPPSGECSSSEHPRSRCGIRVRACHRLHGVSICTKIHVEIYELNFTIYDPALVSTSVHYYTQTRAGYDDTWVKSSLSSCDFALLLVPASFHSTGRGVVSMITLHLQIVCFIRALGHTMRPYGLQGRCTARYEPKCQ